MWLGHWAETAGVDPYSSNPVLRAELNRLANASAVGGISGKIFLPVMPDALALVSDAAEVAYFKDWRELFEDNARLMRGMGASDELIQAFEYNEAFTPLVQTLIVSLLDSMKGAAGRSEVIWQATLLISESEALFFLESVMLAAWYDKEVRPLRQFHHDTLIPVATDKSGDLVAFTAADAFYWSPKSEKISREFTAAYADHSGGRKFIAADYVSPRAERGITAMGWQVRSGLRTQYEVEVPWGVQRE